MAGAVLLVLSVDETSQGWDILGICSFISKENHEIAATVAFYWNNNAPWESENGHRACRRFDGYFADCECSCIRRTLCKSPSQLALQVVLLAHATH